MERGKDRVIDWLLGEDQPSVRYFTLLDVLGYGDGSPEVRRARSQIPKVGWARDLLRLQKPAGYWERREPRTVAAWLDFLYYPVYVATNWRALVLSDLGLTASDPRVEKIAQLMFQYKLRIGSMVNVFNDEVCIVGNTARMLTRFGYADDLRVRKLYDRLIEDQREDGGWNCAPGAPGTLDGWEALAAFAALPRAKRTGRMEATIARGVEFYLRRRLFKEGRRYAPWFRFHYPNHYYYDLLVGLDVVTRLGYAGDRRLRPARALLEGKRRPDGTWAIDRVHPDVGPGAHFTIDPKKVQPFALEPAGRPSKWITLTALRVLKRIEDAG